MFLFLFYISFFFLLGCFMQFEHFSPPRSKKFLAPKNLFFTQKFLFIFVFLDVSGHFPHFLVTEQKRKGKFSEIGKQNVLHPQFFSFLFFRGGELFKIFLATFLFNSTIFFFTFAYFSISGCFMPFGHFSRDWSKKVFFSPIFFSAAILKI